MHRKKKKPPDLTPKVNYTYALIFGIVLSAFGAGVSIYLAKPSTFATGVVNIGNSNLNVEIAKTQKEHRRGLMHRTSLATNHGMLFILDKVQISCMWMKNTKIPLAVAFTNERGEILNIEKMVPETEDNHCSVSPAKYALETNPDWFDIHKIQPGMTLTYQE